MTSTPSNAAAALASLEQQRASLREQDERLQATQKTAEQTLAEVRAVLDRWDQAKARFGEAMDSFVHRMADAMKDEFEPTPEVVGPPEGVFAHGTDGKQPWKPPQMVVKCEKVARTGMKASIMAHEYQDESDVLDAKVKVLASMIRRARKCAAYTGAGISTAAGIGDYASKAGVRSSVLPKKLRDGTPFDAADALNAEPTIAHRALTSLHVAGLMHEWVQQNHDGVRLGAVVCPFEATSPALSPRTPRPQLPQKAGMPQSGLNEIHGSWFDPCNPVVPMNGSLRSDLVARLRETTSSADLVVAMGTSLSGVMADTIVSSVGRRAAEARRAREQETGARLVTRRSIGEDVAVAGEAAETEQGAASAPLPSVVIINAQQTRLDGLASLRIFAKLDDVLKRLCKELGLAPARPIAEPPASRRLPKEDVWDALPYDAEGLPSRDGTVTLDLTRGKQVVLTDGNPPLVLPGSVGVVGPRTKQGHYTVVLQDGKRRTLGLWYLRDAQEGKLPRLPFVNAPPASSAA